MNDVLVAIGEALIDFIPDKKDCPFDDVSAFSPKVGGAPANVCAAYSVLGGKSRLLTQLGDDPFGHKIIKKLSSFGIDMTCVGLTDAANTALAFVSLDKDGNRTFSFYRNPSADMLYSPENVRESFFNNAYALHFCSVDLGDFPMKNAHIRAIEIARKKGAIISFDPNLRFPLWKSRESLYSTVNEFIPLCDIVKISDEELEFITGTDDIKSALPKLFSENVKLIIYTCGKHGAYAFTKTANAFSKGKKVKVVDTTGAGDGFIGSFLWKMNDLKLSADMIGTLTEKQLFDCLEFANEFCAVSVQHSGAIDSYTDIK
jgi:fructokinase